MRLLEMPIRRHQFTLVAFLCLVVLGLYAFQNIPREEDPHIKFAGYFVTAIWPGADPQDLERLVAKPVEDRIAELEGVHRMETTIVDGVAFVAIEFEAWTDAEGKYDEVTREINALRPALPPDLALLEVRRVSPGRVNVTQLALVSADAPYSELEDDARALKDVLKAVPGVRTAESWAFPPRELRVAVDLTSLARYRITPGQLVQALQSENASIPAGVVDLGERSFSLRTSGAYATLGQVRDTVIGGGGGRSVRVRDVADVAWDHGTLSYVGRFNGQRAVFVTASQKDGFNSIRVQQAIDAALDRAQQSLPPRIRLERGFEQARNVSHRLNRLYGDFGIAIALVALTLLPLGWRAAGIVMVSIPLSIAFGLATLYFIGYSLNQISIAGFVVALGLLVDDSIVVVENISRHLRAGGTRVAAALAGTRQIFEAILGCTATLIFAFVPLLALPGNPGKFIRVLPTAVVATIIGSLLIALLVIPFLASRLLPASAPAHGNALLDRVMGLIHRYYRPALHYCLARTRTTVAAAIGGSLALSAALVVLLGSSLFPKADTPQFLIDVQAPNGASFAATDRALRFVEARLAATREVRAWYANLGHGNPQVYYNQIVRNDTSNFGQVFVLLHAYDTRRTPRLLDALRADFDRYPGAHIQVREFTNGVPISAPVSVRVIGPDLAELESLARHVQQLVAATPGTRDVNNPLRVPRTNLRLAIDSQKAGLLGVPTVEIDRAVRLAVAGLPAGTFKNPDGEQYPIVVRAPVGARATLSQLADVRVPSLGGALLPLAQLATPVFERAPTLIQRFNRERAVTIDAGVERGFNTAKVTAAVVRKLDAFAWPRGYRYSLGGEAESSAESFGGIGTAIIVALFGIFAILVLEFGNFKSTLIVLTVVPLGVLGGLLMLLITGNDISFVASIGFVGFGPSGRRSPQVGIAIGLR